MPTASRSAETCAYRRDARHTESGEFAVCSLLEQISGIRDASLLQVCRQACDACSRAFPPTTEDINPIIASHLFSLSEQIIAVGGVQDCSLQRASELNRWAEKSLPAGAPDEDDSGEVGRNVHTDYSWVDVDDILRFLPSPEHAGAGAGGVPAWAVGVTTSARRIATIESSVRSVIQAGWTEPTLFVDGPMDLPSSLLSLNSCRRLPATGAFPNYVLGLSELYMREPSADVYLMLQDDALLLGTPATRQYLECVLWPGDLAWIVSLYCSTEYAQPDSGWKRFEGGWVWGAVAFVFSRKAVEAFLTSMMWVEHRKLPGADGLKRIDVLIGEFALANHIPIYYPSPSMVQHIGTISTLWKTARAVYSRRADQFIGDLIGQR